MYKIGVFDSGVGGLSVANAIEKALPYDKVIFVNDSQHIPYGNKAPEELLEYVVPILEDLVNQGCDLIVIACNTVTTTLIDELRQKIRVPLIGMEPMVKPAMDLSQSKTIAVCATPTTLDSSRYAWLKETYAKDATVLEPDCSDWSFMIENSAVDEDKVASRIEDVCNAGADVIVLACTHYHWIEDLVTKVAGGRAVVLQPESETVQQLSSVLATLER